MTSATAKLIESLPQLIQDKLNIAFDFKHIESLDDYLFLWGEDYSHHYIVRFHIESSSLKLIPIPENIQIHSVRLLSRNNRQWLLISDNRPLRSQVHVISVSNHEQQHIIQNFNNPILQMEQSSISSSTIYVLDKLTFQFSSPFKFQSNSIPIPLR